MAGNAVSFEFATFKAREIERITGVPLDTIRMWRQRGHLRQPKTTHGKHPTFDLADCAELLVMSELTQAGIAVSVAAVAGKAAAGAVMAYAILHDFDLRGVASPVFPIAAEPSRFFIVRRSGEIMRCNDLQQAQAHLDQSAKAVMSFTVIDCEVAAVLLVGKAEKPLCSVKQG